MSEPPINDIPTVSGPDYPRNNEPASMPVIKGYKIIKQLGEGGMGIVYLAEQTEPIRRKVALKVIKPGMDSKEVIARFEAEKQTLAQLDHPNVAHVYDAGTTEKGRPYFVMEYINGVPITDFCDQQRLSIEERLDLFKQVCDGIQHAHQRGIIHRDIKPSNILILTEQDKAIPKVIDFGVAKAISQQLSEQTMFTAQGQLIGTPEYMSPEQADFTGKNIDIRTDVYSLGVVLYQLLAGALPFDPRTLREAAFTEIQRIIKEEEPPRPSTKLSSLGEEAQEVARTRKTALGTLTKRLHKELEWIPLKAMRKESDHRYQSVSELSDDIQNYLSGSPLIAGPESRMYRFRKLVRRNRVLVTSVTLIILILVIGIIASTYFAVKAEKARDLAEQNRKVAEQATEKETAARTQAEQAKEQEIKQRQIAEQERQRAEKETERATKENYISNVNLADSKYYDGEMSLVNKFLKLCPMDLRNWEWFHLWHISDQSSLTLLGHYQYVNSVAFSPDDKYVASGGNDGTIIIWDIKNACEKAQLSTFDTPEPRTIYSIAFSPNGKFLASAHDGGIINIWDMGSSSIICSLYGDEKGRQRVNSVAFSPNGKFIVSGAGYGSSGDKELVKVWSVGTWKQVLCFEAPPVIDCVAFSPDSNYIASGSGGYSSSRINIWNMDDAHLETTIDDTANSLDFSPDGRFLVYSHWGTSIQIRDLKSGTIKSLSSGGVIESVKFSPDNRYIVAGCRDGKVRVWDMQTYTEKEFIGHHGTVHSAAFSSDGNSIVSGGEDGTVKVWNESDRIKHQKYRIFCKGIDIRSMTCGKDGIIILGCSDGTIRLWDNKTESEILKISNPQNERNQGNPYFAYSLVYDPKTDIIASLYTDSTIKVYNANNGLKIKTLIGHKREISSVAISPNGKYLLSSSYFDSSCILWDIETWNIVKYYPVRREGGYNSVAFSLDGKYIIASGYGHDLLDAEHISDTKIAFMPFGPITYDKILISPSGEFVLADTMYKVDVNEIAKDFAQKQEIKVYYENKTIKKVRVFYGGGGFNAFSPDGKRLISSSGGKIVVWDAELGREILIIKHNYSISSLTFSSDGRKIIAGSSDGLIVWDSADGEKTGSVQDDNGGQEIIEATKKGDIDKIKSLLAKNPNLANFKGESSYRWTPLFVVHSKDIAELLIANGADINAKDKDGKTPLYHVFGNNELASFFVEKGADVNVKDKNGNTPLLQASFFNNYELAKLLLEKGADVNVKDRNGNIPLLRASFFRNYKLAKLLLEKGADVNAKANDGKTALGIAKENGSADIVQLLEKAGAKE